MAIDNKEAANDVFLAMLAAKGGDDKMAGDLLRKAFDGLAGASLRNAFPTIPKGAGFRAGRGDLDRGSGSEEGEPGEG